MAKRWCWYPQALTFKMKKKLGDLTEKQYDKTCEYILYQMYDMIKTHLPSDYPHLDTLEYRMFAKDKGGFYEGCLILYKVELAEFKYHFANHTSIWAVWVQDLLEKWFGIESGKSKFNRMFKLINTTWLIKFWDDDFSSKRTGYIYPKIHIRWDDDTII